MEEPAANLAKWPSEHKAAMDRHNMLQAMMPGIIMPCMAPTRSWRTHKLDNVGAVARFVAEEGRLPSKRPTNGIYKGTCPSKEDEKKLGNFAQNLQQDHRNGYLFAELEKKALAVPLLWERITAHAKKAEAKKAAQAKVARTIVKAKPVRAIVRAVPVAGLK
eukprot:TRINITY_DN44695_c0_g1_i1.p1 TRINITY_DN44695_c0_g1~~TRINITY_DN44695_c0_g1_i1.p1  ORF type:complete len:162 (+),score=28.97 TRINITY_DN44695_c0_g1_i1:216-701(+)